MSHVRTLLLLGTMHLSDALIRMPSFFGDNMVLQSNFQSGVRAFISGWATPQEVVTVAAVGLQNHYSNTFTTTATTAGTWSVQLNPPGKFCNVGNCVSSIVVNGSDPAGPVIVARNVSYGDVWLCAGGAAMATNVTTDGAALPKLPPNLRLHTFNPHATASTPWLRSDIDTYASVLAQSSRLCILAAVHFLRLFPNPNTRKMGLIVAATDTDDDLMSWMPEGVAVSQCNAPTAHSLTESRYNTLIKPFALTSVRTVLWALSPPSLPVPGGARAQSCYFRALINRCIGMVDLDRTCVPYWWGGGDGSGTGRSSTRE